MDYDYNVVWTEMADGDLDAIAKYICEQGAPVAAAKLEEKIRFEAAKLSFSPYRVFQDKRRELRKVCVGNYIVLFRIYENTTPKRVQITQVIHGRRNLRRMIR